MLCGNNGVSDIYTDCWQFCQPLVCGICFLFHCLQLQFSLGADTSFSCPITTVGMGCETSELSLTFVSCRCYCCSSLFFLSKRTLVVYRDSRYTHIFILSAKNILLSLSMVEKNSY